MLNIAILKPNLFNLPLHLEEKSFKVCKLHIDYLTRLGNKLIIINGDKIHIKYKNKIHIQELNNKNSSIMAVIPGLHILHLLLKYVMLIRKSNIDLIYTVGDPFEASLLALLGKITAKPTVAYLTIPIESWWSWWPMSNRYWWRGNNVEEFQKGYKLPLKMMLKSFFSPPLKELIWMLPPLVKWGINNLTHVIACSEYVRINLIRYGLSPSKCTKVYYGISIPSLIGQKTSCSPPTITYFGNFRSRRGVLDLVKAVGLITNRNFLLHIAPSEIESQTKEHFDALVEKYGLLNNVIWGGVVNDIYQDLFPISSVIVLPHHDGPSLKLIEAMAAEKPVIATNVEWASEVIQNGKNGLLVEPYDYKELANHISFLLDNYPLALDMGKAAREFAFKECNIELNIRRINESFISICNDIR